MIDERDWVITRLLHLSSVCGLEDHPEFERAAQWFYATYEDDAEFMLEEIANETHHRDDMSQFMREAFKSHREELQDSASAFFNQVKSNALINWYVLKANTRLFYRKLKYRFAE
jgi:hypothetical protein